MGSLQIRQHSPGLPSCLWKSGLQSACQVVCLTHGILLKTASLYIMPNCLSVDNTANITPGYSRTHVKFSTLFQFYAMVHMSSVLHGATLSILKACWAQDIPGKKSPVQSCDRNYSSQRKIQTETGRSSWRVTVVWPTVREQSLGGKTPFSSAQNSSPPSLQEKFFSPPQTAGGGACLFICSSF